MPILSPPCGRPHCFDFNIALMDTGITIETATNHVNYCVIRVAKPLRVAPSKCRQTCQSKQKLSRDDRGNTWHAFTRMGRIL